MITIPEVVKSIIKRSPFLDYALAQKIINLSALARLIKPEVEKGVMKEVQEGAILMALNRLSQKIYPQRKSQKLFDGPPDLLLRSNLIEITFANSESLISRQKTLLDRVKTRQSYFLTITQGIFETTVIANKELRQHILKSYKDEKIISHFDNLSSLNVRLPKNNPLIPGIYSYILKSLAWEGISIIEVVSTCHEFTLVLRDEDIDSAFSTIKHLF